MEQSIILPRKDGNGNYTLSWSQYDLWKTLKSFNLSLEGKLEYMVKYFLGFDFPDIGWAEFGHDVEDYITGRQKGEKFNDKEKFTLEKIQPLGVFQRKINVEFEGFNLIGFIDDEKQDGSKIRDYKTGALKSVAKYKDLDFKQTRFYCMDSYKRTGNIPEAEICLIERKGNAMYGGRKVLTVGDEIVYIPKLVTQKELDDLIVDIQQVACEISEYYKLFLTLNK